MRGTIRIRLRDRLHHELTHTGLLKLTAGDPAGHHAVDVEEVRQQVLVAVRVERVGEVPEPFVDVDYLVVARTNRPVSPPARHVTILAPREKRALGKFTSPLAADQDVQRARLRNSRRARWRNAWLR